MDKKGIIRTTLGLSIVGTIPKILKNPSSDWIFLIYNFLYIGIAFYTAFTINKWLWVYKNTYPYWLKFMIGLFSCVVVLVCVHLFLFDNSPEVLVYFLNLKVLDAYVVLAITFFRSFIVQMVAFSYLFYLKSKNEKMQALEKIKLLKEYSTRKGDSKVEKGTYKDIIFVRFQGKLIPIDVSEIAFFHAADGIVCSYLFSNQKYIQVEPLESFEKVLNPHIFYRANRQFLIHRRAIEHVEQIENRKLRVILSVPQPGEIVISKAKASALIRWLEC